MSAQAAALLRIVGIALAASIGSGCVTNAPALPKSASKVPSSVVFNASQDRVWSAAQAVLATGTPFKVLNKAGAQIVTEFTPVDSKELSLIGVVMLGKTYKTNYSLNMRALDPERTELTVGVRVQVQQVGIVVREESYPELQGHMRQKLFDQLHAILRS